MKRSRVQIISGHRLPEARLTFGAIWLGFVWIGLPILAIGGLMDLGAQVFFGVCTGLWCVAQ